MANLTRLIITTLLLIWLGGCAYHGGLDGVIKQQSSTPAMQVVHGAVLTDNDDAFEHKVRIIEQAKSTLDIAYFIYADDYSSAVMTEALIRAAHRGVHVRLLVDYHTNYKRLDLFSMMEREGTRGRGQLEVRFYNRPTKHIVKDAVFMTLGCGEVNTASREECSPAKYAEIDRLFANETYQGKSIAEKNISNYNSGGSGLFLSGLYGKNPNLMALAVTRGQEVDPDDLRGGNELSDEEKGNLKELGKLYWQARYDSGFNRVVGAIKLKMAFAFYGEKLNPIYNAFSSYLPVERRTGTEQARQDWRYVTDFLHHKLLLADGRYLQLGGRNIEDSYHMRPNPLSAKYTFMDTGVYLELTEGHANPLRKTFDALWRFDTMVVNLQDVRRHAPNDFLVAAGTATQQCVAVTDQRANRICLERELEAAQRISFEERMDVWLDRVKEKAREYRIKYGKLDQGARSAQFDIDPGARLYYFENLPFRYNRDGSIARRGYGAKNGAEGSSGKHIHALWLQALKNVCLTAAPESPKRVVLHNAYFLLPSNLLSTLAQMVDGRIPCAHVDIDVLTNSIETTDLNVVNILNRHSLKALLEHYKTHHDPAHGARFAYYEYLPQSQTANNAPLSLHSKVLIAGDDLFIGSANTDVRSYMMDSNNGVFIRNTPNLLSSYQGWVDAILQNPQMVTDRTQMLVETPREALLQEDRNTVRQILKKYRAERWIQDTAHWAEIDRRVKETLDEIYQLSVEIVADHESSREAQQRFNSLFKSI